ncbi:MAG: hypothetical protein H6525_02215 [Actinobacteria bacterium]|nr:hypothetical protein [Actinomycetota bacterium]
MTLRSALLTSAFPLTDPPAPSPTPSSLARLLKDNPQLAEQLATEATTSRPNSALWSCLALAVVVAAWFLLKHRARRGGRALRAYGRLDPWVQALRSWLAAAPVTFVYVATWTVTTVIFQGTPTTLAGVLNRFNSTNIMGIVTEPVRVLFTSAFIVADYGFFFLGYVAVFLLVITRLEQRIGSARVVLVGTGAHVLGSLLIVALESVLIRAERLSPATVVTQDVGVSYVMVGCAGAYLFLVGKSLRWWYAVGLFVAVVLPLLVLQTIWDLGHFLATVCGMGIFLLLRRWGLRPAMKWRKVAAELEPRPLPTWPTTI